MLYSLKSKPFEIVKYNFLTSLPHLISALIQLKEYEFLMVLCNKDDIQGLHDLHRSIVKKV